MVEDLDALGEIAEFLDNHTEVGQHYEFTRMLEELRKSLIRELDYRQEAHNLAAFREQFKDFTHIIVPAPIADYSTSRVLTMEYVSGVKITEMSPLTRMDFDGEMLAGSFFAPIFNQILVEGFFHADPHPGNVFLTPDHRIALLDLGMVGRIMPRLQEDCAIVARNSEGTARTQHKLRFKNRQPRREFDQTEFTRRISEIIAAKDSHGRANAGGPARSGVTRCAGRMPNSRSA